MKRIAVDVNDKALEALTEIQEEAGFTSVADTIRASLKLMKAIIEQKREGYTEFVVRDPNSNKERHLIFTSLN